MTTKLFRNARIYTPIDPGHPLAGKDQGQLVSYLSGALVIEGGMIRSVGEEADILAGLSPKEIDWEIDCGGQCLIPGFVDSHTHMCFARRREAEFAQRLEGKPYLEILADGGGILSSVRSVRAADFQTLFSVSRRQVLSALILGTTTLEIKSGYGLDLENELKMLAVIDALSRQTPLDIVATYLGAHAIPEEFQKDPDGYVDLIIRKILPAVKAQGIARFCDVFCEKGAFSVSQSQRILETAKGLGLTIKLHADEVHDLGGGRLAARLEAISADHLLAAGRESILAMAAGRTIGILLPATAYSLKKSYAPAREMIDAGVPLALATDCNPGSSYTESMPFVIGLGVMQMGLTPVEALISATINGAYAIAMAHLVGSLEAGKQADFLLMDGETPHILSYHAGVSPVTSVYKRGEKIA